jgi:hypothetical protein
MTRQRNALSHAGGIVLVAVGSACASPTPDAGPRAAGPYMGRPPRGVRGQGRRGGLLRRLRQGGGGSATDRRLASPGAPPSPRSNSDGSYTNESGNHAAIYLYQDERGIWVYDQWQGQPVHKRLIRFKSGRGGKRGSKSNDGRRFAVIE